MTTNQPDPQEPDMTAATVARPATYPHPIGPNLPRFPLGGRQAPAADLRVPASLRAKLEALQARVPADSTDHGPAYAEDPAERKAQVARLAWENSLRAGHVTDLAHWKVADLAKDQHPSALSKYVEVLGPDAAVVNLVLAGRVGPGKTSAAIAAGNAAVERGLMVRFVRHADYLKWLTPSGSPKDMEPWQIEARYRDCDLLILDDMGAGLDPSQPVAEFKRTATLSLIGDRINSGKATIVTTNEVSEVLDADGKIVGGLALMFGAQIVSRMSERGHAIRFTGPDRRGRLKW